MDLLCHQPRAECRKDAQSARQLEAQGLPWRRIDAVNGWELSEDEIARVYDARANARRGKYPLVPAEIGCYLSHIEAWRAIAASDQPGGFIFEDDFAANGTLGPVLRALVEDEPRDWDMVKLFFLRRQSTHPCQPPAGAGFPHRGARQGAHLPDRLWAQARGGGASGFARPALFFRPVDEDQKFFWETGLRVALVLPPPIEVGDQQAETGTIGNARRAATAGRSRLRQGLHGALYQLRYRVLLRWHRWRGTGLNR
ncbi:glycosyltransferase family 25 protein [Jhaorihella thermophila]